METLMTSLWIERRTCREILTLEFRMLVGAIHLLTLFPYTAYEALNVKCNVWYPEHPLHSYRHSGDLIIGGITSHGIFLSYAKDFIKEPPPAMPEELT